MEVRAGRGISAQPPRQWAAPSRAYIVPNGQRLLVQMRHFLLVQQRLRLLLHVRLVALVGGTAHIEALVARAQEVVQVLIVQIEDVKEVTVVDSVHVRLGVVLEAHRAHHRLRLLDLHDRRCRERENVRAADAVGLCGMVGEQLLAS